MKRILSVSAFVAILTAFSISAYAQSDQPQAPVPQEDFSCFKLDGDLNFNFGVVDQNETVEHTFVFKNNCDKVIHIDRAQASCGCTAAVLSEKDINPGGEAKINVKFTPPKLTSGSVTKTVSVFIQGDSRPHSVIRFTADVKTDIALEPRYLNLYGATVGQQITGKATITNKTDQPMAMEDPQISVQSYTDTSSTGTRGAVAIPVNNVVVTPKAFTLEPNETKEITVTLTPQYKGQLNGNIRFKSAKSEVWLQVYGVVRDKNEPEVRQ